MTGHKYQVGETITFQTPAWNRAAAGGTYTVVAHRPAVEGERWYVVKSALERHDRVVRESDLK
jgi:hypothetical protein